MRHCTLLVTGVFLAAAIAACNNSVSPVSLQPTVFKYTTMPPIDEILSEKIIGSASAPNTIYEYLSFWCTGCATFHATIEPQMKSQFVDTGRANIVFRNLFLSTESTAAAALARCVGNADFFAATDYIFTKQGIWLPNGDAGVKTTMMGFGMSPSLEETCVNNTQLQSGLAQVHTSALSQTYQLPDGTTAVGFTHVPAIVVNGVKLDSTTASDGTAIPDNAPTVENIAKYLK
jgi:hypothetical protein